MLLTALGTETSRSLAGNLHNLASQDPSQDSRLDLTAEEQRAVTDALAEFQTGALPKPLVEIRRALTER